MTTPAPPPTGIEAIVCNDIAARQQLGIAKYGTTVADNPLPLRAWLEHAYEECLDQAVYLRRVMAEVDSGNYRKTTEDATLQNLKAKIKDARHTANAFDEFKERSNTTSYTESFKHTIYRQVLESLISLGGVVFKCSPDYDELRIQDESGILRLYGDPAQVMTCANAALRRAILHAELKLARAEKEVAV